MSSVFGIRNALRPGRQRGCSALRRVHFDTRPPASGLEVTRSANRGVEQGSPPASSGGRNRTGAGEVADSEHLAVAFEIREAELARAEHYQKAGRASAVLRGWPAVGVRRRNVEAVARGDECGFFAACDVEALRLRRELLRLHVVAHVIHDDLRLPARAVAIALRRDGRGPRSAFHLGTQDHELRPF